MNSAYCVRVGRRGIGSYHGVAAVALSRALAVKAADDFMLKHNEALWHCHSEEHWEWISAEWMLIVTPVPLYEIAEQNMFLEAKHLQPQNV